jgi:two-component system, sensor histidine kinase PdtaS
MPKIVKNKEQINATVSPWLKKRCAEIAQGPDFSSVSDIVSQALSEFIAKYDDIKAKEAKKHEGNIPEILIYALMQTKDGNEWLESMYGSDQKSSLKMKETESIKNSNSLQEVIKMICNKNEINSSSEKKKSVLHLNE